MHETTHLSCACGAFAVELAGTPFVTAECHCNSCREAATRLQALPAAFPVQAANHGTPYALYRKDRVRFPDGTAGLRAIRLSPQAPTRRVLTRCCNSPVFLEFQGGHWLSLYASLWPETIRPPMSIRTMTSDLPDATRLDDTLPAGKAVTARFYFRLLAAWIAMGFKSPRIDVPD
ncbi:GFA family protein [Devosia chinhatensis]|uniref:CENP-V/GFA domain-containing protein n=1 Tax=Devosia chinhatensis TaxID=429727 RepID=A0A0F5FNE4_9HYPH|nr:hypothetical protein [Devosia chinhatensis]KKB10353.1 hypothetical protein VE26_07615 [Devosia chinhatensis]